MDEAPKPLSQKPKGGVFGDALASTGMGSFHSASMAAFFAFAILGADALSSACYGPAGAFLALGGHISLVAFVLFLTVATIFLISYCYSQIVELFPTGGGGYLAASKFLSPTAGMVSGCALLVDYALTIALSVVVGTEALFSILPPSLYPLRLDASVGIALALVVLNIRGVRNTLSLIVPLSLLFILSHTIIFGLVLTTIPSDYSSFTSNIIADSHKAVAELGIAGIILLILRAYALGAGTFTGLEAISNGMPVIREPRTSAAKKAIYLLAISTALLVAGLMLGYMYFEVGSHPGKSLNAVLFDKVSAGLGPKAAYALVLVTLISETLLLLAASQIGFLNGPIVLAKMAVDRWFPTQFSNLSDRFVTQNGVFIMGGASIALILASKGSLALLLVLYVVNVSITVFMSQLGLVRHWLASSDDKARWQMRIILNGVGLALSAFLLLSVILLNLRGGGIMALLITGSLAGLALLTKNHYQKTLTLIRQLDANVSIRSDKGRGSVGTFDSKAKTAVIFVSDYNGLGVQTLLSVRRVFGDSFGNFLFLQVGLIDAGDFKGHSETERLSEHVKSELKKYVEFSNDNGFYAEAYSAIGEDVVDEVLALAESISAKHPTAVFFGGQAIFPKDTFSNKLLYNQTIFAVQRRLYQRGIPFMILPIPLG